MRLRIVTVQGFERRTGRRYRCQHSFDRRRAFSRTLGMPLIAGREFTRADSSASQNVADRQRGVREEVQPCARRRRRHADGARAQRHSRNSTSRSSAWCRTPKYSGSEGRDSAAVLPAVSPARRACEIELLRALVSRRRVEMNAAVSSHHAASSIPICRSKSLRTMEAQVRERSGRRTCCWRRIVDGIRRARDAAGRNRACMACSRIRLRSARPKSACGSRLARTALRIRQMILGPRRHGCARRAWQSGSPAQ